MKNMPGKHEKDPAITAGPYNKPKGTIKPN